MRVVSRQSANAGGKKKRKTAPRKKGARRNHPKFGTSKLEIDFARDFLDKLGVKYDWQFEAPDIGRFFDYAVYPQNGGILLIEVDGSYYHADPRVVEEGKLNPMQKRNRRVDGLKDKWALMHGIPIMRLWEKDIRDDPNGVMDKLRERLYIEEKKAADKNKRHNNKIR